MQERSIIETVLQWQEAANQRDIPRLLGVSAAEIELVGPRGVAHGQQALSDWVQRAGAQFTARRIFARGECVVVEQHAEWRSLETGALEGEADVASVFDVHMQRVVRVARYEALEQALQAAGLAMADQCRVSQ